KVGARYRKDLGDLPALAESLDRLGLLHPVVIDPPNRLIAGQRRLEAAKLLGWKNVPVRVVDLDDLVAGELAENPHPQDLLPSELWAIAKAIRERVARPRGRPPQAEKVETFHHCDGKTRDKAAFFGLSGRQLDKIAAVCESGYDDLVEQMKVTCFGRAKSE